jgi:hypothetical protein
VAYHGYPGPVVSHRVDSTGTSSSRMVSAAREPVSSTRNHADGPITAPLRRSIKADSRFSTSLRRSRWSSNDLSTDNVHPDLDMKQAQRIQERFLLPRT